jgi:hypothetical protein
MESVFLCPRWLSPCPVSRSAETRLKIFMALVLSNDPRVFGSPGGGGTIAVAMETEDSDDMRRPVSLNGVRSDRGVGVPGLSKRVDDLLLRGLDALDKPSTCSYTKQRGWMSIK